jgi:hypothetical protein
LLATAGAAGATEDTGAAAATLDGNARLPSAVSAVAPPATPLSTLRRVKPPVSGPSAGGGETWSEESGVSDESDEGWSIWDSFLQIFWLAAQKFVRSEEAFLYKDRQASYFSVDSLSLNPGNRPQERAWQGKSVLERSKNRRVPLLSCKIDRWAYGRFAVKKR